MHAYTYAHIRISSACVHIPGETLKCAAVRANTHACPSRTEEVDNPLPLPSPSSPFPHFCLFSSCPLLAASPESAHSARVRTLRDVRVCQWNTLSLSEGWREDEGEVGEGGIGGGTVLGNSGSRSGWWWKTAQSVVTRGTLALHGGL